MNKLQAIKKAMLKRQSADDRDIPKYVQDKAVFFEEEKGYDPAKAFSVAWSIYCKYKAKGGDKHCTRSPSEYLTFQNKTAGSFDNMIIDSINDSLDYLESVTKQVSNQYLFEMTQEYIVENYAPSIEAKIVNLLKRDGVSPIVIKKYLAMVKAKTQDLFI